MNKELKSWKKEYQYKSISYNLLVYILFFSSIITIMATCLQLFMDYRNDINFIYDQFDQVEESYINSISYSLWDYDDNSIFIMLEGILALRDIQYLKITESKGSTFATVGKIESEHVIKRVIPILQAGKQEIGTLEVVASLQGVYDRLFGKLLVILGSQAIKTFLVSSFILFIIQYLVSRHLKKLGNYASEIDLDHLEGDLTLDRKRKIPPDEFELVVDAFNQMRSTLKKSVVDLKIKARMEGELEAAVAIQQAFIPKAPPNVDGYDLASLFIPALEMSGDYFDFFRVNDNCLAMVIADASGKGMPAALHVNTARVLLKDKSELHEKPLSLFRVLNHSLEKEFAEDKFLTMGYLLVNLRSASVICVNAGHEPCIRITANNRDRELIKPPGYPFCSLFADVFDSRLGKEDFTIQQGDLLVLYSDGLTDVTNESGEIFGEHRFYDLVHELNDQPTNEIIASVRDSILAFKGDADLADDVTMVAFKRI